MIPKFDALEQSVKQYQAQMKGKLNSKRDFGQPSMSVIIEKNKKIDLANKLHKLHVIKARQLRIKISQIFNINIKSVSPFYKNSRIRNLSNNNTSRSTLHREKINTQSSQCQQKRILSYKILPNQSKIPKLTPKKTLFKQEQSTQRGGMINLFQKFTEEEINQIQSDQQYFLVTFDMIELFRKFMSKKRLNNKDRSYEKFMLRSHRESMELPSQRVAKMSQHQIKRFIFQRIGQNKPETEIKHHILTNPLSAELAKSNRVEESQRKFYYSSAQLFSQLKRRQIENEQKLRKQQEKKIRKLKIDIFYKDGIASELRAIQMDRKKLLYKQKSSKDIRKSLQFRSRIATLRQSYGSTVEMAEQIRKEFIKKRAQIKKYRFHK